MGGGAAEVAGVVGDGVFFAVYASGKGGFAAVGADGPGFVGCGGTCAAAGG